MAGQVELSGTKRVSEDHGELVGVAGSDGWQRIANRTLIVERARQTRPGPIVGIKYDRPELAFCSAYSSSESGTADEATY
jgi:hypothetical protein